jgi:RimJ/RimL family protein N-acetyltransferase
MPSVWEGKLVRLRAVEPEDWQAFYDWDLDSEGGRMVDFVWFPGSKERHKKQAADLAVAEVKNDEMVWAIETLDGEFVGAIDTHACNRRVGTFEHGLGIRREHWRKGYASEAILLVLRHMFHELRYQKVNAHVFEYNEPSRQLHLKLGFQQEARLRRMLYTNGRFYDELIFGLTAEEFDAIHGECE